MRALHWRRTRGAASTEFVRAWARSSRGEGFFLAVLAAACWGLAPTATKGALTVANPAAIVALRLGVAALVFRTMSGNVRPALPRDRWTWVGGCALGADFVLYTFGLQYTDGAVAGLLVNVEPVPTILLARWLLQERLTRRRLVGSTFILAGVAAASSEGVSWNTLFSSDRAIGNAAVLLAGILWSVYAVSQRRARLQAAFWPRLAGFFEVAFFFSAPFALPLAAIDPNGPWEGWAFLLVLVSLCTIGVYVLYVRAQQCVEVSVLALLLAAIPVFNIASASTLLGEDISPLVFAATGAVLVGVITIASEPSPVRPQPITPAKGLGGSS